MLVQFEQIDLTEGFIIKGKERSREYLRAILTALSAGETSKLKILTLHGRKSKLAADLAKTRERGLKVKVESVFEDDSDWTDSDDKDEIDDNDDIDDNGEIDGSDSFEHDDDNDLENFD